MKPIMLIVLAHTHAPGPNHRARSAGTGRLVQGPGRRWPEGPPWGWLRLWNVLDLGDRRGAFEFWATFSNRRHRPGRGRLRLTPS